MIKRIEVKNLRGIKYFNLHFEEKPVLIYAENGKGKSSIIDAIEWALTGKISSLMGIQGVTLDKHAHHILSNSNQKKVTIELDDNSILEPNAIPGKNTKAEKIRESLGHGLNILRRSQLLRTICVPPKERYEIIRPFLPLDSITEIENAAQKLAVKYENEKKVISIKIKELAAKIAVCLDMDLKAEIKSKNIVDSINKICKETGSPTIQDINMIDSIKPVLEDEAKSVHNIKNLERSQNILLLLKSFDSESELFNIYSSMEKCYGTYEKERQQKDKLFNETVLSLGAKWIKDGNLDKCPLCMNLIDTEYILKSIQNRLNNEAEYIKAKKEYLDSVNEYKTRIEQQLKKVNLIIEQNMNLSDPDLMHFVDISKTVLESIISSNIFKHPDIVGEFDIPIYKNSIDASRLTLISKYERTISSFGNTERTLKIAKLLNAVKCIEEVLPQIKKLMSEYNKLDRAYNFSLKWKETLEKQRKLEVQAIYDSIKEQINYYYCSIHPKDTKCELVGDISLIVKETGGGSALLQAGFHNKQAEDPRGYYSESHLDTLGLCIFLALYKKESERNSAIRLLILDDVLTSVDAPHRKRVAELILSEFKSHQIIITTHDIVWCNDLIGIQRSIGNRFMVLKIDSWNIEEGPKFTDLKTNFDELINLINDGYDKSTISSSAGRLLEFLLKRIRYSLKLAIEAKYEDKYTISDIWPNFYSKVSASGSKRILGSFYDFNRDCIEDIDLFWPVRNDNGCHYNEWAENRSDEEIRAFAKAVMEFYKAIVCPSCGEVVSKVSDKDFYCKCKTLNYSHDKTNPYYSY